MIEKKLTQQVAKVFFRWVRARGASILYQKIAHKPNQTNKKCMVFKTDHDNHDMDYCRAGQTPGMQVLDVHIQLQA